ncbi:MAG TPA: DUF4239 domain-containing protein [Microbacterium sp.]|nr:DUF4239 domain-containing protein [Microbacterium sp.]
MWLYTTPVAIALPVFVVVLVALSLLVVIALRRWVPRSADRAGEWDRVLGYVMAVYAVLYGVTLALIAAASYENFRDVEEIVLEETSSVAVLYRNASGLPEPTKSELQSLIIEYTDHSINVDWPLQADGEIPSHTVRVITTIQEILFSFEPADESESNLHLSAIGALNDLVADRGARIGVTGLALPGILWFVLSIGALLNAVLIGLVEVGRLRTHLIMSAVIAAYVAVVIFAIASFDHVYMGPVSVGPGFFEELREWLFTDPG